MLLVLNLPLVVKGIKNPLSDTLPLILLFCFSARIAFEVANVFDIYVMLAFRLSDTSCIELRARAAGVMAFVLSPLMKRVFQALLLSDGSSRPVCHAPHLSAASSLVALVLIIFAIVPSFQKRRKEMVTEE